MLRRTIGDDRLRLEVSRLCLGTMNFGTRTDEATSFAILDRFRDAGGTFLDTSNNYNQWHWRRQSARSPSWPRPGRRG
ncbi:L-fuco-beta-pyranose dehydrogenase [Alloactinosynnema sp. L-07]|uniref:aldo/keto reductase n=1 Tax=Alloactinosynnema sp. L-07 TaxID=1653480 RepID=UPI00065EFBC4|nr:aldo/keto reductase [Alloactinosynnema sp. L-07]CRK57211.1 L-fuco-beta-pyranose dehydrogenase [Alloactinosynnema sp. L-07]